MEEQHQPQSRMTPVFDPISKEDNLDRDDFVTIWVPKK
jgi:hypothetical protein